MSLAGLLAVTAPPEVHPEPIEALVRSGPVSDEPPASLLAATATVAALVTEAGDGSVSFSFVDRSNAPIAQWQSHRRAAPRLVCTACPTPVVGDATGYYAWSGSSWDPVDIGARRSSLADPLTARFGVLQESGERTSLALVPGFDGTYLLVNDGGATLSTVATGIRPASGEQVDLTGGAGRTYAPLALVREPGGAVVSVQSDIMDPYATSTVAVVRNGQVQTTTIAAGQGVPTAGSAPCVRLAERAPRVVALSTQPLPGSEGRVEPPTVSIVWLSDDLSERHRVELSGFYDHCAVYGDGTVHLWTGAVSGVAADVAVVDPSGVTRTETVMVSDDNNSLVNTLLRRNDPTGTLVAWPLGKPAVVIDEGFATRPGEGLGGNQVLQDDEGGVWVWFSSVRVVARVGPTEDVP